MIVGEAEVQGQVSAPTRRRSAAGTTGPLTNRLFGAALQAGKRVRTETGIAREHVSISRWPSTSPATSSATSSRARSSSSAPGETAELTAQALADQGVSTVFVANRHADRARSLAERFGGEVGSLTRFPAGSSRPTSSSPRPPRRTRSSRPTTSPRSCAPATAGRCAHRHRRAARHRARLRRARRRERLRHGRPAGASSRAT